MYRLSNTAATQVCTYLPTYLVSTITIQFIHVANGRLIQSLKKRIPPAEIIDKVLAYHSSIVFWYWYIYCLKNSYQYKKLGWASSKTGVCIKWSRRHLTNTHILLYYTQNTTTQTASSQFFPEVYENEGYIFSSWLTFLASLELVKPSSSSLRHVHNLRPY